MSDEEITTNNSMDLDLVPNESSSSPASAHATSSVVLDLGIGSGNISDSDDEDIHESLQSKSSTPDSTTVPNIVAKKPFASHKPSLTKSLFYFLINTFQ